MVRHGIRQFNEKFVVSDFIKCYMYILASRAGTNTALFTLCEAVIVGRIVKTALASDTF